MISNPAPHTASTKGLRQEATPVHGIFALGDGWVIADLAADRLLVLNSTARLIWDRWQQGRDAAAIAAELADRFAVSPATARRDVDQAIAQWQAPATDPPPETAGDWRFPTEARLASQPPINPNALVGDYRIHALAVRVHLADAHIHQAIAPLLAAWADTTPATTATAYHIESQAGGYRLRQGLRVIHQGPSLDLVAVMLLHELQLAAYRERDNLCVLHAGAVGRDAECILLPGIAGAGKSTLTAALLHSGLDYLSDDTVPIDAASRQAIALTPPLCIKAGSVTALGDRYPALPQVPVYQRADQPVRYLPPPVGSLGGAAERQVRAVVFPHYQPGSEARLTEMPATQAFALLVNAGVFAHRPRDLAQIAALVDWFGGLPSYALAYDDLDDACRLVQTVLNTRMRSVPQAQYPSGTAPARTGT